MKAVELIEQAMRSGARCESACRMLGLSKRTLLRWRAEGGSVDRRGGPTHPPAHALSEEERAVVLAIATSPAYRDLCPAQIVPRLADTGVYLASESSFYRILRRERMLTHRQSSRPATHSRPRERKAGGPNEVWSYDITYLKSPVSGLFYYLYMAVDIWSRKIVGWAVHEKESEQFARQMILDACGGEAVDPEKLVLHSDNGAPMKAATLLATLQQLGIVASFSRPGVCDDNAFSEALFRTVKHVPEYPRMPFGSLEQAQGWVQRFVRWYNHEHLHSAISFVTPAARHAGVDVQILYKRDKVYKRARQANPSRWSGETRNWNRVETVILNGRKQKAKSSADQTEMSA